MSENTPSVPELENEVAAGNKKLGEETTDLATECQKLTYSRFEEISWS